MHVRKKTRHLGLFVTMICFLLSACGSFPEKKPEKTPEEIQAERIENLTNALSRTQSRLEEIDARLSALTDKVEATKITIDNWTNNVPVKTQNVGSLKTPGLTVASATQKLNDAEADAVEVSDDRGRAAKEFKEALNLFKTQKYTEAEVAFHQFKENHRDSLLAGSAQFYAAESYFHLGEFKLALSEYSKVLSQHPTHPHVASALVRMSYCYEALGNADEAARNLTIAKAQFDGHPAFDLPLPNFSNKPTKVIEVKDESH